MQRLKSKASSKEIKRVLWNFRHDIAIKFGTDYFDSTPYDKQIKELENELEDTFPGFKEINMELIFKEDPEAQDRIRKANPHIYESALYQKYDDLHDKLWEEQDKFRSKKRLESFENAKKIEYEQQKEGTG